MTLTFYELIGLIALLTGFYSIILGYHWWKEASRVKAKTSPQHIQYYNVTTYTNPDVNTAMNDSDYNEIKCAIHNPVTDNMLFSFIISWRHQPYKVEPVHLNEETRLKAHRKLQYIKLKNLQRVYNHNGAYCSLNSKNEKEIKLSNGQLSLLEEMPGLVTTKQIFYTMLNKVIENPVITPEQWTDLKAMFITISMFKVPIPIDDHDEIVCNQIITGRSNPDEATKAPGE